MIGYLHNNVAWRHVMLNACWLRVLDSYIMYIP